MNKLTTVLSALLLSAVIVGCDDGKAENFGEEIDDRVHDASENIKDAANDSARAIEDACEDATDSNC